MYSYIEKNNHWNWKSRHQKLWKELWSTMMVTQFIKYISKNKTKSLKWKIFGFLKITKVKLLLTCLTTIIVHQCFRDFFWKIITITKKRVCKLVRAKSTSLPLAKKVERLKMLSLFCQQSPTHTNPAQTAPSSYQQKLKKQRTWLIKSTFLL